MPMFPFRNIVLILLNLNRMFTAISPWPLHLYHVPLDTLCLGYNTVTLSGPLNPSLDTKGSSTAFIDPSPGSLDALSDTLLPSSLLP